MRVQFLPGLPFMSAKNYDELMQQRQQRQHERERQRARDREFLREQERARALERQRNEDDMLITSICCIL